MLRTVVALLAVALVHPGTSAAQAPDAAPPVEPLDAAPPPAEPAPSPAVAPTPRASPSVVEPETKLVKQHQAKKSKKSKQKSKLRVSGFLQAFFRYTFFTSTDGAVDAPNFRIQRARVAIEGDVLPWLGYDLSIDPRSPEVTGLLRDAYLTIKKLIPHHRIRIGQQKTQFGYENLESSTRLWAVNRTEVSDNLSRGLTLRDIGIGVLGGWPLGHGVKLEDAVTVVNGNGMNTQVDDTRRKSYWGRVGGRYQTDVMWARLGVSGAIGDYIDPADPLDVDPMAVHVAFKRLGADAEIDTPWVFVAAEVVWGREQLPKETNDERGYYVNVVGKAWHRVGPIFRYDVLGDEFQRFTFGGYYGLPDDRLRVLVNYEYRRLKDVVRGDDRLFLWTQVRF